MGCVALVASSAFWIGCAGMDPQAFNAGVADMAGNQAAIEAARGNFQEASKLNAIGGMNRVFSLMPR
jgi:hypothetical protein